MSYKEPLPIKFLLRRALMAKPSHDTYTFATVSFWNSQEVGFSKALGVNLIQILLA